MTAKNIKYFGYARNIALLSDFSKTRIGCIAVMGNKILSSGYNTHKTNPIQQHYNKYRNLDDNTVIAKLHAEIHTLLQIKDLDIDWSKVDIYIYRIYKGIDREFGISRPCPGCMMMIKQLGIRNVWYTSDSGYCYEKLIYE